MDLIRLCKTLSNPDRVALSHAAENMGLRRTVDEAFKLERDLALVAAGGSLEGLDLSLFTLECLYRVGLSNDEAASLKARSVSTEPDFAFAWQRPRGYDLKAAVSRLGPGENEYRLMPQLSGSAIGMCLVRAFTLSMHFWIAVGLFRPESLRRLTDVEADVTWCRRPYRRQRGLWGHLRRLWRVISRSTTCLNFSITDGPLPLPVPLVDVG